MDFIKNVKNFFFFCLLLVYNRYTFPNYKLSGSSDFSTFRKTTFFFWFFSLYRPPWNSRARSKFPRPPLVGAAHDTRIPYPKTSNIRDEGPPLPLWAAVSRAGTSSALGRCSLPRDVPCRHARTMVEIYAYDSLLVGNLETFTHLPRPHLKIWRPIEQQKNVTILKGSDTEGLFYFRLEERPNLLLSNGSLVYRSG